MLTPSSLLGSDAPSASRMVTCNQSLVPAHC
jgi:hypothetical protein